MSKPSVGKELFDTIVAHPGHADTVAYLRAMVNSVPPTVETEYLDFKSASQGGNAIPDADVKKTWSEALAGYATTGGGILVWGIDARKPHGGTIDQATGFNLVVDPDGLKSRLQQLHHQATDPPVPGVVIEAYPDPTQGGHGFVVCFVPESDFKPHRTELGGRRWVMRIGDSFVDVPPPVLRSLFFPHRHSYMFLKMVPSIEKITDRRRNEVVKVTFRIRIYNEGPATAESLVILAKPITGLQYKVPSDWKNVRNPAGWQVRYPEPFHPGQILELCDAVIEFPFAIHAGQSVVNAAPLRFEFHLYATDQIPSQVLIEYSEDDIRSHKESLGLPKPLPLDRYR